MKRKLQITRSVERKLLTLDEPQYEEVKNLLNDLLTDPKLLENSQKLEPDKDDNLLYTRLLKLCTPYGGRERRLDCFVPRNFG